MVGVARQSPDEFEENAATVVTARCKLEAIRITATAIFILQAAMNMNVATNAATTMIRLYGERTSREKSNAILISKAEKTIAIIGFTVPR